MLCRLILVSWSACWGHLNIHSWRSWVPILPEGEAVYLLQRCTYSSITQAHAFAKWHCAGQNTEVEETQGVLIWLGLSEYSCLCATVSCPRHLALKAPSSWFDCSVPKTTMLFLSWPLQSKPTCAFEGQCMLCTMEKIGYANTQERGTAANLFERRHIEIAGYIQKHIFYCWCEGFQKWFWHTCPFLGWILPMKYDVPTIYLLSMGKLRQWDVNSLVHDNARRIWTHLESDSRVCTICHMTSFRDKLDEEWWWSKYWPEHEGEQFVKTDMPW